MLTQDSPEFYTGAPVDAVDLRFREAFLADLWDNLRNNHLVLTAARRTGKTSVMDHMRDYPQNDFTVVSINVQDLTHPAEFFLTLLDAFHDAYPDFMSKVLAPGWRLLKDTLSKVDEVGVGSFKLVLRECDPNWRENWRQYGLDFLKQARCTDTPTLLIVNEFPDLLLNVRRENAELLREFLAWFRTQRLNPAPSRDSVRWLLGGSINLSSTLNSLGLLDLVNDLEDIPLPSLTAHDVQSFVREMLNARGVAFHDKVAQRVRVRLDRPVPLFMQLVTQGLYRLWKKEKRTIIEEDVDLVCDRLIVSSGARTRRQHFYSRIANYYQHPRDSLAYALLGRISASKSGLQKASLIQEAERSMLGLRHDFPLHERRRIFNQLMLDLENDFYIVETESGRYDFASGILKSWWKKYHA